MDLSNTPNKSFWNKTTERPVYPRLKKSIEVDTLIIGSGITGVTTAYCLAQQGAKPVLIEAGGLCDGTTGNTTGKVTIQHDIIYSNIFDKYGTRFAKEYALSQTSGLDFVRQVVKKESINCQLANSTSYIYASSEKDVDSLQREYKVAMELGIDAEMVTQSTFPEKNFGMLGFKNQAVFHPVRYVNELARAAVSHGAEIYCDTKAFHVEDGDIKTITCENDVVIKAKHLVMATQYPIYDGPNIFFSRLYAKRDYGIAVEAKNDWPNGSYINTDKAGRSVRTHIENEKKILIVVGEDHSTGREEEKMSTRFQNLIRFADQIAGVNKVLAQWSAQDYETPDQIPYIGRISDHSNIFVATGYCKWGLTKGSFAGNMISELIMDGKCNYEDLYSRTRPDISKSLGKTVVEVFNSTSEVIKSKFEGSQECRDLGLGEGRIINFKNQKAGIYRDFDDSVTIMDISCSHMSTHLNFNPAEKSWDCPAHGGRYGANGKLLEGPPKHPMKILYQGQFSDLMIHP